jgi:cell division protein FtsB
MAFASLIKSKFVTILLFPVLVLVMIMTARILSQKREIDSQISKLQSEADKIKSNNNQLSNLIKYLNTPDYKDKEAREKLNLKKDGEFVVVLPDSRSTSGTTQTTAKPEVSKFKQWFNYFFPSP